MNISNLIIGQEVQCGDGIGRVVEVNNAFPFEWVKVNTFINNRGCKWSPHSIKVNGKPCHGKYTK